jgi:hypothetical protein
LRVGGRQDVQEGMGAIKKYHGMVADLVSEVQARGPPRPDDITIAARILRIRDESGRPLTLRRIRGEFSTMFAVHAPLGQLDEWSPEYIASISKIFFIKKQQTLICVASLRCTKLQSTFLRSFLVGFEVHGSYVVAP